MFKVNIWSFYLNFPFRTLNLQIMFNYANPENSIELSCISDFVLKVYSYFTVHKHRIQIHLHNYQQESLLFLCVGYHWLKICVGGHCGHGHYPVVVVIISILLVPHLPTHSLLSSQQVEKYFEILFFLQDHWLWCLHLVFRVNKQSSHFSFCIIQDNVHHFGQLIDEELTFNFYFVKLPAQSNTGSWLYFPPLKKKNNKNNNKPHPNSPSFEMLHSALS